MCDQSAVAINIAGCAAEQLASIGARSGGSEQRWQLASGNQVAIAAPQWWCRSQRGRIFSTVPERNNGKRIHAKPSWLEKYLGFLPDCCA
ncbi:hypothetical protein L914_09157 [Phytophthora nicotianae]|uniref:Uncharacterized protein n=3 Tax=Phytophthora nicotianae TaxID=4792 RepID=V9F5R7_PHYNI|nr:hypothetical protein F443_09489 [Phytophthora nicotianae P1569]ETM45895.1 hypothetical protein L914_09157 [Phytophthora nicotianae]ETO74783.1 hypothetical protein F444_09557 [Phytophthora nicotianae P1976]